MTDSHAPFPKPVQKEALERQRRRCASCRTIITGLGRSGAQQHVFGEGVEAHHVIPHKLGGPLTPENCVIICRACHLSAHQGGRFADVSIYNDLKNLTMPAKIARIAALYPHYRG
jgi:HNH endonuclease